MVAFQGECRAGVLWTKCGYDCYRTPGSNDYGVDVVALATGKGQLVQAKTSGTDGTALNWDAVREVVAGEAFYRRRHPAVDFEKVCITNQFFNRQAQENAALNTVELLDQTHLAGLLERHPVTMLEVEKMLYAEWQESASVVHSPHANKQQAEIGPAEWLVIVVLAVVAYY